MPSMSLCVERCRAERERQRGKKGKKMRYGGIAFIFTSQLTDNKNEINVCYANSSFTNIIYHDFLDENLSFQMNAFQ